MELLLLTKLSQSIGISYHYGQIDCSPYLRDQIHQD